MNIWPYRWIGGSSATIFGVEVFGRDRPDWSPIWLAYRAFSWLDNLKWAALHRWHPRHQYSLVRTGLPPGYYDQDTRLLHACMALLVEYVRACEESGVHTIHDEERALFHWWTVERPANHRRLDDWCMRLFSGKFEKWVDEEGRHCCGTRTPPDNSMGTSSEYHAFEDRLHSDDQAMLHRLIDIRPRLWT